MPKNDHVQGMVSLRESVASLCSSSLPKYSDCLIPALALAALRAAELRWVPPGPTSPPLSREVPETFGHRDLPPLFRFDALVSLPQEKVGQALDGAARALEQMRPDMNGILSSSPRYADLDQNTLHTLVETLANVSPSGGEGETFGLLAENILDTLASLEGQGGGEYFTPSSLATLIALILDPQGGQILDPACGAGGLLIRLAQRASRSVPVREISLSGQEKSPITARLCRLNLVGHRLTGMIEVGNSYYEDTFRSLRRFDIVATNPPWNVNSVMREYIRDDPRYALGIPTANANYLWIQLCYSALTDQGRAGIVMANSASDARGLEREIRRRLVQEHVIDVMLQVGPHFFYTSPLPCTLWFFDKGKRQGRRRDQVLFIDARAIFRQLSRSHCDFSPPHISFLSNIVRLYRGEEVQFSDTDSARMMREAFPQGEYTDIAGLCKVATMEEIEARNWSLTPAGYVGVGGDAGERGSFKEQLRELNAELTGLNADSHVLEQQVNASIADLLGKRGPMEKGGSD